MRRRGWQLVLVGLLSVLPGPTHASGQALDWDPQESEAHGVLRWLREERDAGVGLLDNALDLQLGIFSELALLTSTVTMASSDLVGLVDDNGWSEHVTKASFSKSLAKTALLLHVVGSESILGSHGLEIEWYLEESLTELNPLLDPDEHGPVLPLNPMAFVGEGLLHSEVYTARFPGGIACASIIADGLVRPLGNLLRIVGLWGPADALEERGDALVRGAVP